MGELLDLYAPVNAQQDSDDPQTLLGPPSPGTPTQRGPLTAAKVQPLIAREYG